MTSDLLDPQQLLDDALAADRLGLTVRGPEVRLRRCARAMEHIRRRNRDRYGKVIISRDGEALRVIDGGKLEGMIR